MTINAAAQLCCSNYAIRSQRRVPSCCTSTDFEFQEGCTDIIPGQVYLAAVLSTNIQRSRVQILLLICFAHMRSLVRLLATTHPFQI